MPTVAYLLRDLANTLVESALEGPVRDEADGVRQQAIERVALVERSLALEKDFPTLRLAPAGATPTNDADPIWISYGDDPWLVNLAPPYGELPAAIVAVRARKILDSLDIARVWSDRFPTGIEVLTHNDGGEPP